MKITSFLLCFMAVAWLAPAADADEVVGDSLELIGTWAWDATYGGLAGAYQSPKSSGYDLVLRLTQGHEYSLIERDSVSEYLCCSGRYTLLPTRGWGSIEHVGRAFAYLQPEGWALDLWAQRSNQQASFLVAIRGQDTLYLYPGWPGGSLTDALTDRYIRKAATSDGSLHPRPRSERPPRLVSSGYGYAFEFPDSFAKMYRMTFGLHQRQDYPEAVRSTYPYRHDQAPSAVMGFFDDDRTLDVVRYGVNDGAVEEIVCVFDWNRAQSVATLDTFPQADRPRLYLQRLLRGSSVSLPGGREHLLPRDAVLATYEDGHKAVYEWSGGSFARMELAK